MLPPPISALSHTGPRYCSTPIENLACRIRSRDSTGHRVAGSAEACPALPPSERDVEDGNLAQLRSGSQLPRKLYFG
eukprot:scaffold5092_cov61-Cylindrotheca_fusiformis.AAC.3